MLQKYLLCLSKKEKTQPDRPRQEDDEHVPLMNNKDGKQPREHV